MLKNTAQSSLEDINNVALPPSSMMPFYSIVKDKPNRKRCEEADFIANTFSVSKGNQSSRKPSKKALSGVDYVSGYVSTSFRKF